MGMSCLVRRRNRAIRGFSCGFSLLDTDSAGARSGAFESGPLAGSARRIRFPFRDDLWPSFLYGVLRCSTVFYGVLRCGEQWCRKKSPLLALTSSKTIDSSIILLSPKNRDDRCAASVTGEKGADCSIIAAQDHQRLLNRGDLRSRDWHYRIATQPAIGAPRKKPKQSDGYGLSRVKSLAPHLNARFEWSHRRDGTRRIRDPAGHDSFRFYRDRIDTDGRRRNDGSTRPEKIHSVDHCGPEADRIGVQVALDLLGGSAVRTAASFRFSAHSNTTTVDPPSMCSLRH